MEDMLERIEELISELSSKIDDLESGIESAIESAVESSMSDVESAVESAAEDAVESAMADHASSVSAPLLVVFTQDRKKILPVYSVRARRIKKDQAPYGIWVQWSASGASEMAGQYDSKELALSEVANIAKMISNGSTFYTMK